MKNINILILCAVALIIAIMATLIVKAQFNLQMIKVINLKHKLNKIQQQLK